MARLLSFGSESFRFLFLPEVQKLERTELKLCLFFLMVSGSVFRCKKRTKTSVQQ
jgi:hypothetical protein